MESCIYGSSPVPGIKDLFAVEVLEQQATEEMGYESSVLQRGCAQLRRSERVDCEAQLTLIVRLLGSNDFFFYSEEA